MLVASATHGRGWGLLWPCWLWIMIVSRRAGILGYSFVFNESLQRVSITRLQIATLRGVEASYYVGLGKNVKDLSREKLFLGRYNSIIATQ